MKENNIIFFSNNTRGIFVLKKLLESDFKVILLITCKEKKSLFENFFNKNKIREISDVNDSSFLKELKSLNPSLFIVAGFPQIFKKDLLKIPSHGALNLHAGPLPKYRGGSPLNWQLINGEKNIGISIIKMKEGIDNGNIIESEYFERNQNDTIADLHKKANQIFPFLTIKAIQKLLDGFNGFVQEESKAIYWHQRNDEDGFLNLKKNSTDILLFIKALTHPYKGAWTYYNDTKLRIYSAEKSSFKIQGTLGKILYLQGEGPFMICSDNCIKLTDYKIENNNFSKLTQGTILGR